MRFLPIIVFAIAPTLFLSPVRVFAANKAAKTSADAKERVARKACLKGDPEKGVGILTDLFVDTGDLTYIFNQGRCFEQNRRYEDAIGRFREFLIKATDFSKEDRADAEKHIAACESYLAKTSPPPASVGPDAPTSAPMTEQPKRPEQTETTQATPVGTHAALAQENPSGGGLRIAGIVLGSIGIAAVAAGVAFNIKANSMTKDLEKPENYSRSTDSTREDYKTFAWISYGAGAACIATAGILYYWGWGSKKHSAPDLALVPKIDPSIAGAALTGAF
jgi:hypothetical protein